MIIKFYEKEEVKLGRTLIAKTKKRMKHSLFPSLKGYWETFLKLF
jgi:hypothetical protein